MRSAEPAWWPASTIRSRTHRRARPEARRSAHHGDRAGRDLRRLALDGPRGAAPARAGGHRARSAGPGAIHLGLGLAWSRAADDEVREHHRGSATARGYSVSSAVLDVSLGTANTKESDALGIPVDSEVIRLLRIRYGDGEPLVIGATRSPRNDARPDRAPQDGAVPLTAALAGHGHQVNASIATITAVELPRRVAASTSQASAPGCTFAEVGMTPATACSMQRITTAAARCRSACCATADALIQRAA